MNLRYLEYFLVLATTEHVTKAADILYISQPSLSNAISSLEKDLGVALVEKHGRNIVLTPHGKEYAKYVRRGFAELEAGKTYLLSCTSPQTGHINLGFFHSLGVRFIPQLVQEFLELPGYREYTFSYDSGNEAKLTGGLKNGLYDLIFCSTKWDEPAISYYPIHPQKMRVIVSSSHRLAGRGKISLQELQGEPFISYSQPNGLQCVISKILQDNGVKVNVVQRTEQGSAIAGMVARNFGVSILPDIPLPELDICFLDVVEPIPPRWIYAAVLKDRALPVAAENLLHYALTRGQTESDIELDEWTYAP